MNNNNNNMMPNAAAATAAAAAARTMANNNNNNVYSPTSSNDSVSSCCSDDSALPVVDLNKVRSLETPSAARQSLEQPILGLSVGGEALLDDLGLNLQEDDVFLQQEQQQQAQQQAELQQQAQQQAQQQEQAELQQQAELQRQQQSLLEIKAKETETMDMDTSSSSSGSSSTPELKKTGEDDNEDVVLEDDSEQQQQQEISPASPGVTAASALAAERHQNDNDDNNDDNDNDEQWKQYFRRIVIYKAIHESIHIPFDYIDPDTSLSLGQWITRQCKILSPYLQQTSEQRGTRIHYRITKLKSLDFLSHMTGNEIPITVPVINQQQQQQRPPRDDAAADALAVVAAVVLNQPPPQQQQPVQRKSDSPLVAKLRQQQQKQLQHGDAAAAAAAVITTATNGSNSETTTAKKASLAPQNSNAKQVDLIQQSTTITVNNTNNNNCGDAVAAVAAATMSNQSRNVQKSGDTAAESSVETNGKTTAAPAASMATVAAASSNNSNSFVEKDWGKTVSAARRCCPTTMVTNIAAAAVGSKQHHLTGNNTTAASASAVVATATMDTTIGGTMATNNNNNTKVLAAGMLQNDHLATKTTIKTTTTTTDRGETHLATAAVATAHNDGSVDKTTTTTTTGTTTISNKSATRQNGEDDKIPSGQRRRRLRISSNDGSSCSQSSSSLLQLSASCDNVLTCAGNWHANLDPPVVGGPQANASATAPTIANNSQLPSVRDAVMAHTGLAPNSKMDHSKLHDVTRCVNNFSTTALPGALQGEVTTTGSSQSEDSTDISRTGRFLIQDAAVTMNKKRCPPTTMESKSSSDMDVSVSGDEGVESTTQPPQLADEEIDWEATSEDYNEEQDLMDRLDEKITLAEEQELMHKLDENIAKDEVADAQDRERSVHVAEEAQGAMIPNIELPDDDSTDFKSWMVQQKWTDNLQGPMILEKHSPEITKLVPKALISTHDLHTQIIPQVSRDVSDRSIVRITARLEDVARDPSSWILRVRGGDELFWLLFHKRLQEHLNQKIYIMNHSLLMEQGTEIEIIVTSSTTKIGATLEELHYDVDGRQEARLLLRKCADQTCTIPRLLDAIEAGGAAVIIDGSAQVSKQTFRRLFHQSREQNYDFAFKIRAPPVRTALSVGTIFTGDFDNTNESGPPANGPTIDRPGADDEPADPGPDTPSLEESETDEATDDAAYHDDPDSSPTTADKESPRALKCYRHFHAKFLEAAKIEFSGADINLKLVLSSMWGQHKREFPKKSCDEKCRCVFMLPFMAEKVVEDKIAKVAEEKVAATKKNKELPKEWSNPMGLKAGDFPVGFLSHFSSRFLPKLEARYPGEMSQQTLKRLVYMWRTHERNAYFGQKCGAECECIDHWETLFNYGLLDDRRVVEHRTLSTDESMGVSRRPSKDESATGKRKAVPQADDSTTLDHVPKKQRLTTAEDEPIIGGEPPESLEVGSETSKRNASNSDPSSIADHVPKKRKLDNGQQKRTSWDETILLDAGLERGAGGMPGQAESGVRCEYEVTFKTSEPMGYYFVTVLRDGRSQCTVHSVCPFLARSRDARIQKGTTVRSASIVSAGVAVERQDIDTFTDLKNLYEAAGTEKNELKVWFINLGVDREVYSDPTTENWAFEKYKGARRNGWAGGSYENALRAVTPRRNSQAKVAHALPTITIPTAIREARRASLQANAENKALATDSLTHASLQANAESKALATNSLTHASLQGNAESKALATNSVAHEDWVTINTLRSLRPDLQPRTVLKKADRKASSRGSHKVRFNDLLDERRQYEINGKTNEFKVRKSSAASVSGTGHPVSLHQMHSRERELRQAVENESLVDVVRLLENGAATDDDVDLQELRVIINGKEGLGFKEIDRVLKVWINGEAAVEASRALKNWVHFEIVMESIDEVNFSGHAEADGLVLKLKARKPDNAKQSTEELAALRLPRLEKSVTFESHNSGKMVYNVKTTAERMFEIELTSEERGVIGFVHIQSGDLYAKCKSVGKWESFLHDVTPTDMALGGLVGAKLRVKARKVDLPKDYIQTRRNRTRERVANVVEWIKQFNEERAKEGMHNCQISINTPFYREENLLQSAIYLEHLPLVELVIKAGGRVGGRAISLALNLADGDRLALNSGDTSSNNQSDRRKIREDIVEFLRETMMRQNGQVGESNQSSQSSSSHDHALDPSSRPDNCDDNEDEQDLASRPDHSHDHDDDVEHDLSSRGVSEETETSHVPQPGTEQHSSLLLSKPSSSTLPRLSLRWLETKTIKPTYTCRFFRDPKGCKRGESCQYVHIHGPFGLVLNEKWDDVGNQALPMSPAYFQDHLHVEEKIDSTGRLWYTAGFSSAVGKYAMKQNVFYAEGGNSVQNEQLVHWYMTREDAVEALKRVCTFAAWADGSNSQGAHSHLVCGNTGPHKASPSSSRPVVDPFSGGCLRASPSSTRPVLNLAGLSPHGDIHQPGSWNNNGSEQGFTLSLPSRAQRSVPILPNLSIPRSSPVPPMPQPSVMPHVPPDWLTPTQHSNLCRDFERTGLCPRHHGKKCTYLHLQQPWGAVLDSTWPHVIDNKSLPMTLELFERRTVVLEKEDSAGRLWYTARFNNEAAPYAEGNRFVFYAEGGDSVPNDQSLHWYSTREAAVEAVKRVYIFSFWAYRHGLSSHPSCDSRGPSPSSSRPVVDPLAGGGFLNASPSSSRPVANFAGFLAQHEIHQPGVWMPPHLPIPPHPSAMPQVSDSWLLPERPEYLCRHFEHQGWCPHAKTCTFVHLQQPWGQVLEANWSNVSDKSLPVEKSYFEKHMIEYEKKDSTGRLWYTACFNSVNKKSFSANRCMIFAEGGDSVPNEQSIHWYSTRESAVDALKRVYTFSFWAYERHIPPPCHNQQSLPQHSTELNYQG